LNQQVNEKGKGKALQKKIQETKSGFGNGTV